MKKLMALSAAAVVVLGLVPGAAHAAEPTTAPEPTFTVVNKFERVAGDKATGQTLARVRKHVDDAMRRSQLVSASELDTFTAEVAGSQITAVVPRGVRPTSAVVVTQKGSDQVAFGAAFDTTEEVSEPKATGHTAGSGLPRVSGACRTIYFGNPTANTGRDEIYDCWEKFKKSNSEYIYNRYSKMTVAQSSSAIRREVQEFTIRFRQARGSNAITGGPYNYGPRPGSLECNNAKFSYGGLDIPLVSCGGIQNLAGGSYYQTGTKYLGHETKQKYIDSYARYTSNGTVPAWSDYVWVQMASCGDIPFVPCANGLNKYESTWNDGLWSR